MPRCLSCEHCLKVTDFRGKNKGNKKSKIRKAFEYRHQCTKPVDSTKKRRATEMDALLHSGSGGRIRSSTSPDLPPTPHQRSTRPKDSLNEDIYFDQAKFDEYLQLVHLCTETFENSKSAKVRAEGPSMIAKMRALLHPSVKMEVDYDEAMKDVSNVAFMWRMNSAAGKKAFIPDLEDRDLCYNAVKIFSLAAEESQSIPREFCCEFGEDGIHVYNDLLEIIGERDKNCLPFVNLCLRTWLDHLKVGTDVQIDFALLDFDKWVEDKLTEPPSNEHGQKTSYQLMMAVFGNQQSKSENITRNAPSSKTSCPPLKDNKSLTKSPTVFSNPHRKSNERSSKLKIVGKRVRDRLIKSHYYRNKQHSLDKATAEMEEFIGSSSRGELNKHVMRSCREASQKMEDLLFSVGGAERIVATLQYFRDRQSVQELDKAMEVIDGDASNKNRSKEGKLQGMVMDGLKNFLGMFNSGGRGKRSIEDQNIYDAIMAAINTKELTSAKLGRMLSRTLKVSRRQIKRGRAIRADLEDKDKQNWTRRSSSVPKNAIKEGKIFLYFYIITQGIHNYCI